MEKSLGGLGELVRSLREQKGMTQDQVSKAVVPATNRSVVAHLEQGIRVPSADVLESICKLVGVPESYWRPFAEPSSQRRIEIEEALSELVGRPVGIAGHDAATARAAAEQMAQLFESDPSEAQALDLFNSILTYFGVRHVTRPFFRRYIGAAGLQSTESLMRAVRRFQADAIRLFSTFARAFDQMNSGDLEQVLAPLNTRADDDYRGRIEWNEVKVIPDERLPDLGYISAARVRQELADRQSVATFLRELATKIRSVGKSAVQQETEKKRRKMDSLMRRFGTKLVHQLMSPLFVPDPDQLDNEAALIAPAENADLTRMEETQSIAQQNLAKYLSADHLDVYVATSMRSDADFVSVNAFVQRLFSHEDVRPLKLRYFNPTQSWIEDRVAKGLVEALMLRRSSLTIYMAQKEDTFGKDSEASVALGQGKPVIVFVPRLFVEDANIDSAQLGRESAASLQEVLRREGNDEDREPDETLDQQALFSRLVEVRLQRLAGGQLARAVRGHWADFDLYGEVARIQEAGGLTAEEARAAFRKWLDAVIRERKDVDPPQELKGQIVRALVAGAVNFEKRAKIFREVHPLALQVILSTGVLNGILVARSVENCAALIGALVRNDLKLELQVDAYNYRLVEKTTDSTVRVISRHQLIGHSFATHYRA